MEEKGLWKRLAVFWTGAGPEMGSMPRRLWRKPGTAKKAQDGKGTTESVFPFFKKDETRVFVGGVPAERPAGRKFSFSAGVYRTEAGLLAAGGIPGQEERQEKTESGMTEKSRTPRKKTPAEKAPFWKIRKAWDDTPEMARAFLLGEPEEGGRKRKTLPAAGHMQQGRRRTEGGAAAGWKRDTYQEQDRESAFGKKEEARAAKRERDAQLDIDRLMREMTKRLWEEREGCGRRLGG